MPQQAGRDSSPALTNHFLEHLPQPDRCAVLVALAWLTRLDKRVTESERVFLRELGEQLSLSAAEIDGAIAKSETIDDPRVAIQAIGSDWVRELMLQQLVAAAFCDGAYDARERRGIRKLAEASAVPFATVESWERALAQGLYERMEHEEELLTTTQEILAEREARKEWSFTRIAKIAAGGVLGGSAVVLTGGAAAPALLAALGASGAVAVAGGLSSLGSEELPTATVGVGPFGEEAGVVASQLFGGDESSKRFAERALSAGLEETALEHVEGRSGHLVIGVSGFAEEKDELITDWRALEQAYPDAERYALSWEGSRLRALGTMLEEQAPHGDALDRAWRTIDDKARHVGALLGEFIEQGWLGRRPISLVGFSSGATVVLEALRAMGPEGRKVCVDSVVLLGGTPRVDESFLRELAEEIGGTLFNGYCADDAQLKELQAEAIGVGPICEGSTRVRNLHFEALGGDHLAYRAQLGAMLEQARAHGA